MLIFSKIILRKNALNREVSSLHSDNATYNIARPSRQHLLLWVLFIRVYTNQVVRNQSINQSIFVYSSLSERKPAIHNSHTRSSYASLPRLTLQPLWRNLGFARVWRYAIGRADFMLRSVNDTTNHGPLYIAAAVVNMMCSTRVSALLLASVMLRGLLEWFFYSQFLPLMSVAMRSRRHSFSISFPSNFRIIFPFPSRKNSHIS